MTAQFECAAAVAPGANFGARRREASLRVAEDLKKKSYQVSDPTRNITLNRKERAELEAAALAEAFGCWLSEFTGRETRGSDGLFEDLSDGVVLALMLARLGVDVDKPRDPVRNAFEARENMQKVQAACRKAGFNCVPSVDVGAGVLPMLLEAAAVSNAQNLKRDRDEAAGLLVAARRASIALPAALVKRLGEVKDSAVIARATEGALVEAAVAQAAVVVAAAAVAVEPAATEAMPPPALKKRVSIESDAKLAGAAVPAVVPQPAKRVSIDSSSPTPSPLLAAARKRAEQQQPAAAPKERARSASEIPQAEKDQLLSQCLMVLAALVLVWFLFLR